MIYWNSFSDFIAMGGYGFYVWGSFGLTGLIMLGEPILIINGRQARLKVLRRQIQADSLQRSS